MTVHGTNFEPLRAEQLATQSAKLPRVTTVGPDMSQEVLTDFYYGYVHGNMEPPALQMSRTHFAIEIRRCRVICSTVHERKRLAAVWGVEFDEDKQGLFVHILFLLGQGVNDAILRAIVMRSYLIARRASMSRGEYRQGVRIHIGGRRGWRRRLRAIGVPVDDEGWSREPEFDPLKVME